MGTRRGRGGDAAGARRGNLGLEAKIWACMFKSWSGGSNLGLDAQIWAWRIKSGPGSSNLCLEAQIWAQRLES